MRLKTIYQTRLYWQITAREAFFICKDKLIDLWANPRVKRLVYVTFTPIVVLFALRLIVLVGGNFSSLGMYFLTLISIAMVSSIITFIWNGNDGTWFSVSLLTITFGLSVFILYSIGIFVFSVLFSPLGFFVLSPQEACEKLWINNPSYKVFIFSEGQCLWQNGKELINVDSIKGFNLLIWENNK